jgi:hypothetical protein
VSREVGGRKDVLMGEVDVNLRREEVEETGVGGPCFLIRLARWYRALSYSVDGGRLGRDDGVVIKSGRRKSLVS